MEKNLQIALSEKDRRGGRLKKQEKTTKIMDILSTVGLKQNTGGGGSRLNFG